MQQSTPGSRRGLWITVGVVVLAAVVIALLIAFSGGGSGAEGTGGY
jgi:hypothetical protein